VLLFLGLVMMLPSLHSQVKQTHDVVVGFLQLKDGLNLGMVFNGFQLEYRYGIQWTIKNHEIGYQPRFGAGYVFHRGVLGNIMDDVQLHIAPVNVTWTMPFFEQNGHTIKGGLNFITDYNYQIYDDLHDSKLFWTTEIGFSPVIRYSYQWNEKRICIGLQNSLFGFISHTQEYDPYLWIIWQDFFKKPHTDLKFGSFNNYNRTTVSFEYVPNTSKKHSFMYEFDYFGIYYGNKFSRIGHNLIWRLSL